MVGAEVGWRFVEDAPHVERDCLLFEAGEYPDRGITVTEDDLAAIAANTAGEVPVCIEHLQRSPFDGALGVVTGLRAVGNRLFGTLRQSAEAWRFVQRAGAKSLSIALDLPAKRIAEVSFVCRPRVAGARVFGCDNGAGPGGLALFTSPPLFSDAGARPEETNRMNVRQFAEGLFQYMRGVLGNEAPESALFAHSVERDQLRAEREALALERAERQIEDLKRRGLLRATEQVESLASSLLRFGATNVVHFGADQLKLDKMIVQLLEANGPVIPMGEVVAGSPDTGCASDRLISMARETARRDSISYLTAFSQVSAAHPDIARAAREESVGR